MFPTNGANYMSRKVADYIVFHFLEYHPSNGRMFDLVT